MSEQILEQNGLYESARKLLSAYNGKINLFQLFVAQLSKFYTAMT